MSTLIREGKEMSTEKTEAILKGGMQEFLTQGYAATSMDRVASAAKVSKATVYRHFQDKESLFIALIDHLVSSKFGSVFKPINEQVSPTEPEIILRDLANRILDVDPEFLNFMRLILGESGRFPQLARAFVTNIDKTAFKLICEYFRTCPDLKLSDPEVTARIFIGALVHFKIVQEMMHGKDIVPMERDRLINSLIKLILTKN
ncbi:TetR/AcrR family transcriptional regulator [Gloeocapsa sp. PCC 73106]|uniref:TetR/AcrR family transcriptional regulator n=1 Tax=Gloeocapsa sp. PCC 73106 TaxID=102232 RepID=UPI0002AD0178|nr:TetR/AcrR family transcriptional regulator [Gloeocapsa sp. PCC 73106]ELR97140.1 transcriptional regulator [Gloeocapsa sp. PCC 73106]